LNKFIIIPARLKSSRLPNKVILDLLGKPLVQWVYEKSKEAKNIDDVFIALDDQKVIEKVKNFTNNYILTSEAHSSGTDRLAEAVTKIKNIDDNDVIINVQGDEPLIDSNLIDSLVSLFEEDKNLNIASAMHKIEKVRDLKSPNNVKVITDKNNFALYFSRSIIPHHRDEWESLLNHHETIPYPLTFFQHIGIYAYRVGFLKKISKLEQTYLEKLEKLEQLRVLENGFKIKMIETNYKSIGVDTEEDFNAVKEIISQKVK
jgi:3-deoxy-manno-octulosonate cytidylyltransferase (CMP-KDO synthetase)